MIDYPLREAALRYARAGQPIFPCGVLGKKPNGKLVHHGVKDATTRSAEIEDWWSRVPRGNIGWATQVRGSDPWALDVDTKHGVDGWATVERLNAEHSKDPIPLAGPRPVTPSKPPEGSGLKQGGHIWLRAEDGLPVPSKVSIAPGLDTRGEGGYVLVAPSRTEDGEYQGAPPLDPSIVPYAPPWLLAMIRDAKPSPEHGESRAFPGRAAPANAEEIAGEAVRIAAEYWKPGDRRLLTHGLAVFFGRDLGLSRDRTEALVRAVADSAGDREPIARDKIADAWKRVGKGERASVRYWLDQARLPELGARLFELMRGLPEPEVPSGDAAALFSEVVERIRAHYYFEEEWHYTICALFVFQAWAVRAGALPATFYLYFGGAFSTGKSNILSLVASLTDGLLFENVSPAALARVIENARTVLLDEVDVDRGSELDEVMSSLLRSGYRRNGPPCVRWNAKEKKSETIPIFGPKCGTFRSALDPALQSRGFVIPTGKPVGEESYALVLANLWSKTGDLVPRLKAWGKAAAKDWKSDTLEGLAKTSEFQAEVRKVAGTLGANRESELLVARMIPVDVSVSLSSASELRKVEISEDQAEAIEELRDVVLVTMSKTLSFAADGHEVYRVVQRTVRDAVNLRRKDRQEKPVPPGRLALLRRELGVKDSWLATHGHAIVWNLPKAFVDGLGDTPAGYSHAPPVLPSVTEGNSPPPIDLPSVTEGHSNVSGEGGAWEVGSTMGVPGGGVSPPADLPLPPDGRPPAHNDPVLEEAENWTVPPQDRAKPKEGPA